METVKKRIPCIAPDSNGIPVLYVQGEPFLILGGELHNSSSSSLEFMEKEVWPYIRQFKMNTVILPVAWESIEAREGCFDFTLLDGILSQARREKVRVVLLWFGLWKNGESFYVPSWVKEDDRRFFQGMLWDRKTIQYGFSFLQGSCGSRQKGILQANEVSA